MAAFKFYKTGKSGIRILWVILLAILMHKVLPMVPHLWNFAVMGISRLWILINRRRFIYVILNIIIISILISSSSFTNKLNHFLLKINKKSSHNISSLISQTSHKILLPLDDDTWWSTIVNDEEIESFTPLDESHALGDKEKRTVPFEVRGVERLLEVKEEENFDEKNNDDHVEVVAATLDATWKAIMEAKNKGSGLQLTKSGTWNSGDKGGYGGGGEVAKAVGKERLSRYKVELKKWHTFNREVVQEKKDCRGGGGGGGGWRGMEGELTYHDELKKRADAFIARVNQDMRLQRVESDKRLLDSMNRGL